MAEYTKDKRFSIGWVIGGAVIMFLANLLGGFVCAGAGITDLWTLAGVACGCYAIGGFVIGWQSEGSTILEAGLAAAATVIALAAIRGITTDPEALAIGAGIPFVAGIIGAWIGEKVQGDVIRTED